MVFVPVPNLTRRKKVAHELAQFVQWRGGINLPSSHRHHPPSLFEVTARHRQQQVLEYYLFIITSRQNNLTTISCVSWNSGGADKIVLRNNFKVRERVVFSTRVSFF